MTHILDQEARGLADKLRPLPPERRRAILARACLLACETINDLEPETRELLQTVSGGDSLSETQVAQAKSLADDADDRYFASRDEGAEEAVWFNWFAKARLLTAIAVGFGGESWSDTAEAVYELCQTREDSSQIIAAVESGIEPPGVLER